MKLVPAKCPSCGADIEVDKNSDKTICDYCNTKIIVDEAIQKIEFSGEVVVSNAPKVGNLLKLAFEHYNMKEYQEAYAEYTKVCELDPDNKIAKLRKGLCKSAMSGTLNIDTMSLSNALVKVITGEQNQVVKNQYIIESLNILLYLDNKNDMFRSSQIADANNTLSYFNCLYNIINTYDYIMNFIFDNNLYFENKIIIRKLITKSLAKMGYTKYVNGYPTKSNLEPNKQNKNYLKSLLAKYK